MRLASALTSDDSDHVACAARATAPSSDGAPATRAAPAAPGFDTCCTVAPMPVGEVAEVVAPREAVVVAQQEDLRR